MKLLATLSTWPRKRWPADNLPEPDQAPGMLPIVT